MAWPGESPEVGAMLEIRGADGLHEEVGQSGEWGLFHLLEAGSVTEGGPGSSVFRVTWHLRTHNVNISVDIRPVRGQTPFFDAAAGTSNSDFMAPVRGSALAAPRNIVANRRVCNI